MTVDEACEFFKDIPKIEKKLSVIKEAGLGYIRLGQPAPTLKRRGSAEGKACYRAFKAV